MYVVWHTQVPHNLKFTEGFLTAYGLLACFHFYLDVLSLSSKFVLFSLLFCYCQLDVYAFGIFYLQGRKRFLVSNLWQRTALSFGYSELTAQGDTSSVANQIKQGFKMNPRCNAQPSGIGAVIVCLSKTSQHARWAVHDQPYPPLSPSPRAYSHQPPGRVSSPELNPVLNSIPSHLIGQNTNGACRMVFLHSAPTAGTARVCTPAALWH